MNFVFMESWHQQHVVNLSLSLLLDWTSLCLAQVTTVPGPMVLAASIAQ